MSRPLLLLGGQGAGKGTIGRFLARELKAIHLSAGSLLRAHVREGGRWASEIELRIHQGLHVREEISYGLLAARIAALAPSQDLILDGYPRGLDDLTRLAAVLGCEPKSVLLLEVPRPIAVERLLSREICEICDAPYGPGVASRKSGVCDDCGGTLSRRQDDSLHSIGRRIDGWEARRVPLITHLEHQGAVVSSIDASRSIAEVRDLALFAAARVRN